MVAPAKETPKHSIWLSNLDLIFSRSSTPVLYYYKPNADPAFFSQGLLKPALAEALVPFYPLAGRLVLGPDGRMEIDCTGDGVLFVMARSDLSVSDIGDFAPSDKLRRLLVPGLESGVTPYILFAIQVEYEPCILNSQLIRNGNILC
ncbi:hypothetical protein J5N97_007303 [Dioscorea zingiberensis]|uniref:Uncharacterized protein n=1 Tax=Dioscorea zingiberensis TaxID=325984 RepID=A0A9D5DEM6_9LILI|nr:hypothetical protein J5N97_007303 [Dioscorea zingiberensis]